MKYLLLLGTLAGFVSVLYGVYLIYPPTAFIVGGVFLVLMGLLYDYDRGGKRETARRTPRK